MSRNNGYSRPHVWSFERRLVALAAVVLTALGVATYLTWRSARDVTASLASTAHSHRTIEAVQRVLQLNADAETATRGFLIGSLPDFLEPYRDAVRQMPGALEHVRALTGTAPGRRDDLARLQQVVGDHMAWRVRLLDVTRTQGLDAGRRLVTEGGGRRRMDAVRSSCARLVAAERVTLAASDDAFAAINRRLRATLSVLGALAVVGLTVPLLFVRHHLAERVKVDARIADVNASLEARVLERTEELHRTVEALRQSVAAREDAEQALRAANVELQEALEASRGAQKALHESQQRLQLALDAAQIGEWELDLLTGAATRSLRHDQIFGATEPLPVWTFEIFLDHVHPDDRPRVKDLFEAGVQAGEWHFECRIVRLDGAVRAIWARGAVLKEGDIPSRMVGMVADVTETMEAQEALRESEATTRMILANARDAVVTVDETATVIGWNGQAQGIFGWSEAEALGRRVADLVIPADEREAHGARFQRFRTMGEEPPRSGLRMLRRDGTTLPVEVSVSSFVRGGRLLVTAFIRDITERVRLDAELRTLQAQLERRVAERTRALEEANQELEAFSYSVSHDLRAPLRHIQGYVEMLRRATEGQLSAKASRYLDTVSSAGHDMGVLIDDLLAFSRMARAEMRLRAVDLESLVRECIETLTPSLRGRRVEWSLGRLPVVQGDRAMLKQVFLNLLDNAVKYTRPREPARISVDFVGEEPDGLVLVVRDNGVGFDPAYAHKLFGVFQRLHRTDEFEGTGIGLANVRRIVSRHGGRTWAEGKIDQGAAVYLTLQPGPGRSHTGEASA